MEAVLAFSVEGAQAATVETARDTSSRDGESRRGETTPRVLRPSSVQAERRRRSAATEASKARAGRVEGVVGVETEGCKPAGGDDLRCPSLCLSRSSWGDGRLCRDDAFGGGRAPGRRKPRRGSGLLCERNSERAGTDSRHVEPRGRACESHDDGAAQAAAQAPLAGSQRRGGDGFRKECRRVWRSKPLEGESP